MAATAESVVAALKAAEKTVATAESCTGGLLGKLLTDVAGSSAVYPGGVISYSCAVKHRYLGVDQRDLDTLGPVSKPVARQMAEGVRAGMKADWHHGIGRARLRRFRPSGGTGLCGFGRGRVDHLRGASSER